MSGQRFKTGDRVYAQEDIDALTSENARLKHVISGCIPWLASHGRGMAQEALADACEAIGADPFMWTSRPDVLIRRRPDLDRRTGSRSERRGEAQPPTEGTGSSA